MGQKPPHTRSYRILRGNGAALAVAGIVFALLGPGGLLEKLTLGAVLLVPGLLAFLGARRFEAWERRRAEEAAHQQANGEQAETSD